MIPAADQPALGELAPAATFANPPQRIALLVSSMGLGGAERVAATLCNRWASLGRTVWLMPTYFGQREVAYALDPRVQLTYLEDLVGDRCAALLPSTVQKITALRGWLREQRPDLVIAFLTNVNCWAIIAARGLGIPLAVAERTDPAGGIEMRWPLRLARALTYGGADWLVMQTPSAGERLRQRLPWPPPIAVIPNPLPDDLATSSRRAVQTPAGGKVVTIGRLVRSKRFADLIRAFANALGGRPEWSLEIWGEGPLQAELAAQIANSAAADRIHLRGKTAEPWDVLYAAQVFVLTSQYEGFPNALMEAMALGLACVAYDCPSGPADLSGEDQAVVLLPVGDVAGLEMELRRLADSAPARSELGRRAARRVRTEYSEARILARWDLLARGSATPLPGSVRQ